MLDNFGMGEFLMLALFALLFFGPERLPQIGAQLGKWLSKLTSYSKAFMNQWTEEAAAVQGAVQDVMMIRDEIRAAQAEIAESLNAAQQDINETISVAKGTIQAATPTVDGLAQAGTPALANAEDANRFQGPRGSSSGGDDSEAVSKTQDIVNSLLAKQGIEPQEDAEPEDETAPAEAMDEDEAYQKNLAAIQELMGESAETAPEQTASSGDEAQVEETDQKDTKAPSDEAAQDTGAQAGGLLGGSIYAGQASGDQVTEGESKPKREETETAFDKTQAILNKLMGIEPEPEPEPEPAETPSDGSDTSDAGAASDVPEEPEAEAPAVDGEPAAAPPAETAAQAMAVQHTRGPGNGVSMSDFTKLSIEVNLLKRELRTLREELQTLRTDDPGNKGDSSSAIAVEEVA